MRGYDVYLTQEVLAFGGWSLQVLVLSQSTFTVANTSIRKFLAFAFCAVSQICISSRVTENNDRIIEQKTEPTIYVRSTDVDSE
jgi:hypothetical protein